MLHFAYSAINPVAIKSVMRVVGLPAGPMRKPLSSLEGAALQRGINISLDLGLDKIYGYKIDGTSAVAAE